jgi:hypothetical protein
MMSPGAQRTAKLRGSSAVISRLTFVRLADEFVRERHCFEPAFLDATREVAEEVLQARIVEDRAVSVIAFWPPF